MAYFLNLYSPETYDIYSKSSQTLSGFRLTQKNKANVIQKGDKFICYVTKVSRWCGILDILSTSFVDESPLYFPVNDPFVVRFQVRPVIWLPIDRAIPIRDPIIWDHLSFTKNVDTKSSQWTGPLRSSLVRLNDDDGQYLEKAILNQAVKAQEYEIDLDEFSKLIGHLVQRADRTVSVTVPEISEIENLEASTTIEPNTIRESLKIQALIAKIGAEMGLKIWIPKADRGGVLSEWTPPANALLDLLPLNYNDATLKTIEQIDVIWFKNSSIVRAFEVEHTTSIYSGILRMADLLALQPNIKIKLHLVAPDERREKCFQEIRRPVFSLLENGPLSESCSYLSYENIRKLAAKEHLQHMTDSVVNDFVESADD